MATRPIGLMALAIVLGCAAPRPRPPVPGEDTCAQCRMTLADPRFAGELVTTTGQVLVYDDVGCLLAALATRDASRDHSIWVMDVLSPDTLLPVTAMVFLRTGGIRTPMGHGVVATRPGPRADSLGRAHGTRPVAWAEARRWPIDEGHR